MSSSESILKDIFHCLDKENVKCQKQKSVFKRVYFKDSGSDTSSDKENEKKHRKENSKKGRSIS